MRTYTCIEDLRQAARRKVPRAFFEYGDHGSYAQETLRANRQDLCAIKLRQRVLVHPVAAVDLLLLVHPEAEPRFEQPHPVGTDHHRDDRVGVGRDRRDRRAVVLGADRVPDDPGDLASGFRVGAHHAERDLVAYRLLPRGNVSLLTLQQYQAKSDTKARRAASKP